MGLSRIQYVIDSRHIYRNKADESANEQTKAIYAKVFEPTFDDKEEYQMLMRQILKLRSRETMLDITSFYNRSPTEHPLSASYFF
jgi:hypothetical protein